MLSTLTQAEDVACPSVLPAGRSGSCVLMEDMEMLAGMDDVPYKRDKELVGVPRLYLYWVSSVGLRERSKARKVG